MPDQKPPIESVPPRQIKAYDKYGREVLIAAEQWRQEVLPGRLQQVWDDPQALYQTILVAVQDGFQKDVLDASRHLIALDPNTEGIVCLHGIVLLRNERNEEAEKLYWDYLAAHPKSAYVRTNLAKAVAERGDAAGAEALLWQALEIDPNQDNGLLWWGAIHKERGGDPGFLDAMQRVAAVPGSWRAELWLARNALEQKDLESALGYYKIVLERAPDNPDALMMISGDLGNNGYIDQIVHVLGPIYMPQRHGPFAGFNLLQAYLATKDLAGARRLLHELFELNRPDLQAHLVRFAQECDKLKDELEPIRQDASPPSTEWAILATPVWYPDLDDPVWLLPKKREAERILFVTFANTTRLSIQEATRQKTDDIGRLTRSIPLYLAEAFLFETGFVVASALPLVNGHYPVVSGADWTKDHVLQLARSGERHMDYVVTGSISEEAGEYTVAFHVWNVAAETETATFSQTGGKSKIGRIIAALQSDLLQFFHKPRAVQSTPISATYRAPGADLLGEYLLAIDQSLTLLLAVRAGSGNELWGERSLLGVPLDLSLRMVGAPIPKLTFLAGLIRNKDYGSEIYQEFKPQMLALLEDSDIDGPLTRLSPLVYRLFDDPEEFLLVKDRLRKSATGDYDAWLDKLQFHPFS
jgi:tetratricopeptide (TPR) repeat protein